MKTTDYLDSELDRLPNGHVFTYSEILKEVSRKEAVIKALNRMVASGKLSKLAKGKFYKPENTPFGTLQPNQEQVVKDLLKERGKIVGYLTGYSIYNQLGLSTQVSNSVQIGKNQIRPNFNRERYSIAIIRQSNPITKGNIPFLQILDAIRYIKKIPDSTVEQSCRRLLAILINFSEKDLVTLVRLSLNYPPATRALLGALLEQLTYKTATAPLAKSLNPITRYKLPGVAKVLSTTEKWNLK